MDNLPELEFRYSKPYDRELTKSQGKNFERKEAEQNYSDFIEDLKGHWTDEKEETVLKFISESTGLDWKEETIPVYFVNHLAVSGFSDPLTVKIDNRYALVCETLVHELTHRIITQNREATTDVLQHLREIYPNEAPRTRLHIIVCAVTRKVSTQVFGEKHYKEAYKMVSNFKGLKRPFQILEDLYPDLEGNIIESLSQL